MEWIVSLTPQVAADPIEAIANPPASASIVELRLDLFPELDVGSAVGACPLPVLATLRSIAEGGEGPVDPAIRGRIIGAARNAGAALLDLEHRRDASLANDLGLSPEETILSWHDPGGTPDGLVEIAGSLFDNPARWIKIVPSATRLADVIDLLDLHRQFNGGRSHDRRLMTFAMGIPGLASRYLAPLLGPPIAYAAWNDAAPAAPGQLSIERTESVIGHLEGSPQRIYGVVGADVSASLSPVLHAAGYRSLSLPFVMIPISVPDPDELVALFAPRGKTPFDRVGLEAWGWAVTTPYKAEAAAAADHHAPRVLRAGAANTLILGDQHIIAENTDADGVVGSLVSLGVELQGLAAVVQGTGGAARGAAIGLHLAGANVTLRGRSAARTQQTAEAIQIGWCGPDEAAPENAILVNATSVGHQPGEAPPFSEDEIAHASAVVDMVYAEHTTELVAHAREFGRPVADGREVLLHQGIAQFAAFTQRVPPKEAMRASLGKAE
jgi:shikimate dehydrogenase/3-dehydroquinate dehydratase type I